MMIKLSKKENHSLTPIYETEQNQKNIAFKFMRYVIKNQSKCCNYRDYRGFPIYKSIKKER